MTGRPTEAQLRAIRRAREALDAGEALVPASYTDQAARLAYLVGCLRGRLHDLLAAAGELADVTPVTRPCLNGNPHHPHEYGNSACPGVALAVPAVPIAATVTGTCGARATLKSDPSKVFYCDQAGEHDLHSAPGWDEGDPDITWPAAPARAAS